jgi:hypothetical protein
LFERSGVQSHKIKGYFVHNGTEMKHLFQNCENKTSSTEVLHCHCTYMVTTQQTWQDECSVRMLSLHQSSSASRGSLLGEVDITLLMADLRLIFTRTQEMVPYGESALFCLAQYRFVSESAILLYSGRHYETSTSSIMFSYTDLDVLLTPYEHSTVKCGHLTTLSVRSVM